MNVTKPQDMESGISKLEEIITKFEEKFSKEEKDNDYYHLVIVGEYNRKICDKVEEIYLEAGWSDVRCRTSSENGERGGLTSLKLYK